MRAILFFFLLFLAGNIFAQSDSTRIVRFSFGYSDTNLSNGVASVASVNSKISEFDAGLTLGFLLKNNWEIGAGAGYEHAHSEAFSEIFDSELFRCVQRTDIKIHAISGKIYAAYHYRIVRNLYFNPVFSVNIGYAKGDMYVESFEALYDRSDPTLTHDYFTHQTSEAKVSYTDFALRINPAISYYFSRRAAVTLNFGNFQLNMTDWDIDTSQWIASFRPAYWQLGLLFAF